MTKKQKGGGGARWFYVAAGILVLGGGAWLLTAGRIGGEPEELPPLSLTETTGIEADPGAGTAIGPEDAAIEIWDFSDYLCPHCRTFNGTVGKLLRRQYAVAGGPLRWVSYEFPLREPSIPPTIAAHCAKEQGRYWDMHDMLFARIEFWAGEKNPNDRFVDLAEEIGLDSRAFRSCLRERRGIREVLSSRKFGEEMKVGGTPTIFVNGQPVPQTMQFYSYQGLDSFIREQAAQASGEVSGE